jgi:hypothetical protein
MNNGDKEMAALVEVLDGDQEFQLALGELVGRYRKKRERAITDREAAQLLPKVGVVNAAIRQACHRSTVYRRVSRATKVARQIPDATKA